MPEKSGILILDKSDGMTSLVAVKRAAALMGEKKGGHTGTLDPMATGVLPVLIGRATGASAYLTEGDKHYRARMLLGITTDTEDVTGKVLTESDGIPTEREVREVCATFVGKIMQVPPMYSAISQGGVRLHELARRGIVVEREAREIEIFSLHVTRVSDKEYDLDVHCSKGTYIRTLCADIGATLGCGAVMSALRRTEAAGFSIDMAHTLDALAEMDGDARAACLIPTRKIFDKLPAVTPAPFFVRLARSGCELYQRKIGTSYPTGTRVVIDYGDGSFALGEVREFEGGSAIKPIKQF